MMLCGRLTCCSSNRRSHKKLAVSMGYALEPMVMLKVAMRPLPTAMEQTLMPMVTWKVAMEPWLAVKPQVLKTSSMSPSLRRKRKHLQAWLVS